MGGRESNEGPTDVIKTRASAPGPVQGRCYLWTSTSSPVTHPQVTRNSLRNMSSFLDLPLELRYQVYSYTAIPTSTYFFTFHGLYLSCHQVRNEMGPECGSILQKHLDHLEHSLPVGTIKFDPSAFGKQHVQMSLSSLFTGEKFNKPNPGFMQVCQMHLAHIQLELPPQDFLFVNTMAAISFLGGLARRKIVKASCITFEASAPFRPWGSSKARLT